MSPPKCSSLRREEVFGSLSDSGRLSCTESVADQLHALVLEAASVVPLHVEAAMALDAGREKKD